MLQPRQAFFAPTAIPQSLLLEWHTPSSLPLEGSAVLNDTPVACQTRRPTRRETGGTAKPWQMRRRRRSGVSVVFVSAGDSFAPAGSVPPIPRRRQPPPTHCGASRRNGRDLIIAKNDQRTSPYPRTASAAAAQAVQAIPEPTLLPTALHARVHTSKSA